ncbi:MAG: hypothetical protein ACXV5Q_08375 [Frankiaceae bacterium]
MSTDCEKAHVTIEIPTCGPCPRPGGEDGPGREGAPPPLSTPFLVAPSLPGDPGTRPIPADQALYSRAIGWTIANPAAAGGWSEFQIQLSCAVANLGDVASPAAMIEFYTGAALDVRDQDHAALTPAEVKAGVTLVGRGSFTAPPGAVTTVTCPVDWIPGAAETAHQGVLVQVRDLFTDPWTAPFDAVNDRHVARNDDLMPRVWNTGVDPNAAPLQPGAPDPHWQLRAGPGVAAAQPAVVLTEQHPGGAYFAADDSMWIWQDAAGTGDVGPTYTFGVSIDLAGFDLTTVTISGAWGADNDGTITLNGHQAAGIGTFTLQDAAHDNYNREHAFTINAGFVDGINTLEIQVTNADGPAGLSVTGLTVSGARV